MSISKKKVVLGAAMLAVVAGGAAYAASLFLRQPVYKQPIAFNHKRHGEEDLKCLDCHTGADKQPHAGIPTVKACMLCHSEAKGNHPDEPRIRELAEKNLPIPWIQVNRLPGHVFFSHVAHVKYAKLDCQECHGEMKDRTLPVDRSQVSHLDMDACMKCHAEKKAGNDCLECHK